jgi:hypothetical protein
MVDQQVRPQRPLVLRHDAHEVLLDLHRVDGVVGQVEPVADARHVRVDGDADVLVVRVAEHDVGRLAADAGELGELVHRGRHLAAVPLGEGRPHRPQAFGLVAVEPRGLDVLLERLLRHARVVLGRAVLLEQVFRHEVDPLVRALGRQDRRDDQLERVREVEAAPGVRIGLFEDRQDGGDAPAALDDLFALGSRHG